MTSREKRYLCDLCRKPVEKRYAVCGEYFCLEYPFAVMMTDKDEDWVLVAYNFKYRREAEKWIRNNSTHLYRPTAVFDLRRGNVEGKCSLDY